MTTVFKLACDIFAIPTKIGLVQHFATFNVLFLSLNLRPVHIDKFRNQDSGSRDRVKLDLQQTIWRAHARPTGRTLDCPYMAAGKDITLKLVSGIRLQHSSHRLRTIL